MTADARSGPTHLFVYGTLQPGDVRWPELERFVADLGRPDRVVGELFDTGLGYPAALFSGDRMIHGRTYATRIDTLTACLNHLDRVEGTVQGLYRRVTVTTARGYTAWAYEYGGGLTLQPIPHGDWMNR